MLGVGGRVQGVGCKVQGGGDVITKCLGHGVSSLVFDVWC